ncbi:hypothetical protein Pla8534_06270 [Lignipirellula cremea]|uniref:Uncharacterized protein n=2 Tax=Lignipirellula cremea TaxID=2528010 RepID=A0A518DLY9_9BACT|nr:hypothetical protein Pla8534_06270 [Lignipirellula cremea]
MTGVLRSALLLTAMAWLLGAGFDARLLAEDEPPAVVPLRKDVNALAGFRYTRLAEEAFEAAVIPEDPEWDEPTRLRHWVRAGDWEAVGKFLALFEPESARRLHTKILSDLSYANPKPTLLPEDVLALADASPVELDERQITHLGSIMRTAMRESEFRTELVEALTQGTKRLGGPDPDRRRLAGRLLAGALLYAEAKSFGLTDAELPEEARGLNLTPLSSGRNWEETVAVLRKDPLSPEDHAAALEDLHQLLLSSTPQAARQHLRALLTTPADHELAQEVVGIIGQKTALASREVDMASRTIHLELQHLALEQVEAVDGFTKAPWPIIANLAAANWLNEALYSYKTYPSWQRSTTESSRDRNAHVPVEHLVQHAPSGKWMLALEPQLATQVRTVLTRLILFSKDISRATAPIRELQKTDHQAAAALANAYLENWALRHDPNLSPEMLKEYRLDSSQVVVLTRSEQEASLKQLGGMLAALDPSTRDLLEETHLVEAFDFCHSRAEIFTLAHIVQVFGPLESLSPELALQLVDRMRTKLAQQWRDLSVQRDAATRRTAADVFELVNQGYAEAALIAQQWLDSHPDSWRMQSAAGSLLADWAEFAYFQSVAVEDGGDRFDAYLERSAKSLDHFRAGAKAYAGQVKSLGREEFSLLPFRAWFYGLLGITHDGGINLRKGVADEGLAELRQAILDLPGGAGESHLQLFSAMIAENLEENRIAPEMKYRYLSSGVQVTGSRATVYPAEEKVKYYDSLLQEIHLQTRVDGDEKIHAPGVFGLFVSLVHTADVARESGGFGKYVMNEVQRTVSGRTVIEKPLYRDRLEESLRVSLGNFFEIRTIAFADPTAGVRDAPTPPGAGDRPWQETPLCYLLLAVKDPTVDRIPALEIELDFFDREGKVILPAPSHPLPIEISADAPAQRPARNVSVTQIVDSRELADQRLKIDVVAAADGLAPDLDQLLRLSDYSLPVTEIVEQQNLHVHRLHHGPDGLYPQSERSWTLHLDPTKLLRGASRQIEFQFPQAISADTQMAYRRYEDMDPVEAAANVTLAEGEPVEQLALVDYRWWGAGAVGVLLLAGLGVLLVRNRKDAVAVGPPLFTLPAELTPFSVIALLHRIQRSPAVQLSEDQRQQLQADIRTLEQQTFAPQAKTAAPAELQTIASRWVDAAAPATLATAG